MSKVNRQRVGRLSVAPAARLAALIGAAIGRTCYDLLTEPSTSPRHYASFGRPARDTGREGSTIANRLLHSHLSRQIPFPVRPCIFLFSS